MFAASGAAIYTMGIGDFSREHVVRRLMCRGVEFVVDIRSPPYAFDMSDFFPEELSKFLSVQGLRYLNLSDNLGDRPRDISLHTSMKRIDYRRYLSRRYASEGISRIALAYTIGCRVCVLGREAKPVYAHHARLVGQGLAERDVGVRHISMYGDAMMSHAALVRQINLLGETVHFSPAP